jgi:hypothetical protein
MKEREKRIKKIYMLGEELTLRVTSGEEGVVWFEPSSRGDPEGKP